MQTVLFRTYPNVDKNYPFSTECGIDWLTKKYNISNVESDKPLKVEPHNCKYLEGGLIADTMNLMYQVLVKQLPGIRLIVRPLTSLENMNDFGSYLEAPEDLMDTLSEMGAAVTVCSAPEWSLMKERADMSIAMPSVFESSSIAIYATLGTDLKRSSRIFQAFDVFNCNLWMILLAFVLVSKILPHVRAKLGELPKAYVRSGCFIVFAFATSLFFALYRSGVLSAILVTNEVAWFNDLDSLSALVKTGKATYVVWHDHVNSTADLVRGTGLASALEENPARLVDFFSEALAVVDAEPERTFTIINHLFARFVKLSSDGMVRMVPLGELGSGRMVNVVTMYCSESQSNGTVIEHLRRAIDEIQPSLYDLVDAYTARMSDQNEAADRQMYKWQLKPITLTQYSSAFATWLSGLLIGVGTYLLEGLYWRRVGKSRGK